LVGFLWIGLRGELSSGREGGEVSSEPGVGVIRIH
jgi:hypothetical protein